MFENLTTPDIRALWEKLAEWSGSHLLSFDASIELLLIIVAFLLASVSQRLLRPRLISSIDKFDMPFRARQILKNFTKLGSSFIALIVIFIGSTILTVIFGMNNDIAEIALKLLAAWIVIRAILQLIENAFVRNIFALLIWTIAALSIFGILDQTAETLDAIALTIGTYRISVLAVIKGLVAIFILLYLALFASSFLERRVFKASSLSRTSQVLLAKVIRVCLIVFALLIGVTSAGIDLSLFAVFGGAIGLGIGFGLQKGISNLFSGMLLLMDRSIKPGDVIELPDMQTFGWVNHMAARYTEIVTRDNKSFLIPNEDFITQRVVNWSHGDSLIRLEVEFGVHYDSDPHLVKKICEEAATKPERVVETPKPVCWLVEFGDSSLNFKLRFWIRDAESGVTNIRGTVMMALWDAFQEHNIKIPYPHREVYMHGQ